MLSVTVTGLETLQNEVNEEIGKISKKSTSALNTVGSEMFANLRKHLHNEWYLGYVPKVYRRRTDNESLGTPLGSGDYMDYSVNADTLTFTYEPLGTHANKDWYDRDRDELVESIQTGRLKGDPPPRPFWNSFLYEQEQSGIINAFAAGMKPEYTVITEGNDVVGVQSESSLASGISEFHIYGAEAEDLSDPDLPF